MLINLPMSASSCNPCAESPVNYATLHDLHGLSAMTMRPSATPIKLSNLHRPLILQQAYPEFVGLAAAPLLMLRKRQNL